MNTEHEFEKEEFTFKHPLMFELGTKMNTVNRLTQTHCPLFCTFKHFLPTMHRDTMTAASGAFRVSVPCPRTL